MSTVLAIAGSARRGGNSDAVLGAAVDAFRAQGAQVEMLIARRLNIRPCTACVGCWDTGRCVMPGPMRDLYPRFEQADHIVVASPVYFTSLPGHLKVLIDRFQPYWVRTHRLKQPLQPRRTGMFLCTAALESERHYTGCLTTIRSWLAALNVTCPVARFYGGVDERDDLVTNHPEFLEDARQAAHELLAGAGS